MVQEASFATAAVPRRRQLPIFSFIILGVFVIVAILAPFLAPHPPTEQALAERLTPAFWMDGGTTRFLLGTDRLGRDILSRIIYGARASFLVALVSVALGGMPGGAVGIVSGYYGGKIDALIMRVVDASLSFPTIFLALILVVALGPSLGSVIAAISLVLWGRFARVARGETLSVKHADFVTYARVAGCSNLRIMAAHIAPQIVNTWLVMATLQLGYVIMLEASLSFLGAGIPPPTPSWGSMVADGRGLMSTAWWVSTWPGSAILLVVLSINLFGDWVRGRLDPKLRQI